jgi:replicative DNA helicase
MSNKNASTKIDKMETIILSSLIHSKEFERLAGIYTKPAFFEDPTHKLVYEVMESHKNSYGKYPDESVFAIELERVPNISEELYRSSLDLTSKILSEKANIAVSKLSLEWLKEKSQNYFQFRSTYLAILEALDIIDGKNKKISKDHIPDLMREAISIEFDSDIGVNYLEDFDAQFDYYHSKVFKIATPLQALNEVTKGGFEPKTLNVVVAPTGVGKTHVMTYFSARYLEDGHDVLYVTLEESENKIRERIDQCLFDCTGEELRKYPKDVFLKKIAKLKAKTTGKLFIKEFPTSSVNVVAIRRLLEELKTKKGFSPKIIVLDYLNLLLSSKYKGSSDNSYGLVKAIAAEIRGMAMELDLMVLSATQTNRSGQNASDFDLNEVSESHGLAQTADFMMGIISTEDLEKMNQLRVKILKSRYGEKHRSFIVGIDRSKMTMYDIDTLQSTMNANAVTIGQTPSPKTKNDPFGGFVV